MQIRVALQSQAFDAGDLSDKPGWVRGSFRPEMSDAEVDGVCQAIVQIAQQVDDGRAAFDARTLFEIDAILMDLRMPQMDGSGSSPHDPALGDRTRPAAGTDRRDQCDRRSRQRGRHAGGGRR